jgi:sulfur-carrier protein adenylyltransferase/sulfurtransferase
MRYSKQIALSEIGNEGQNKLNQARVLVIGAGGLGCPVLSNLTAAGVGNIGIVDGDKVEISNLHRQLLYKSTDCGKLKVEAAQTNLQLQNPEVNVQVLSNYFSANNAFEIAKNYDIIVDCTDTLEARYLINDVAVYFKIPMVYASLHQYSGQMAVFNYKNGPTYRCLFPETNNLSQIPTCESAGVLGILPNILGSLQAAEVLKIILDVGTVFSGKLLIYNLLNIKTQEISFNKNYKQIEVATRSALQMIHSFNLNISIGWDEVMQFKEEKQVVQFIDVSNPNEFEVNDLLQTRNLPLSTLNETILKFEINQKLVFICQTGKRATIAADVAIKKGFTNCYFLAGGLQNFKKTEQWKLTNP